MGKFFDTDRKIRLGIWGLGRGGTFMNAANALNYEIVAGCDYNPIIRDQFKEKCPDAFITDDEEEFLNTPMDAVLIATFFISHAEHTIRALEKGLHVMCEVTSFFTPAEGVKLVEAVERSGKVYNLLENYPFTRDNMYLAKLYREGFFGEFQYAEFEYYMLNKPMGCVSATVDNLHKTVLELIDTKIRKDLFPVGRLDIDTEGLLLITNDGELAHQLLSPKKHVDKTYYAEIEGKVTKEDVVAFLEGLDIGEETITLPAKLVIKKSGDISQIEVTIQEGKFHQVKRMFAALGNSVEKLKRTKIGNIELDKSLLPGEFRALTLQELNSFIQN